MEITLRAYFRVRSVAESPPRVLKLTARRRYPKPHTVVFPKIIGYND